MEHEAKIKLSPAQHQWLVALSYSFAPLCCPGREIASYKALANFNLATKEQWDGEPRPGWVITEAGRKWLKEHDDHV